MRAHVPTLISTSVMPCSTHHAKASRRDRCFTPAVIRLATWQYFAAKAVRVAGVRVLTLA